MAGGTPYLSAMAILTSGGPSHVRRCHRLGDSVRSATFLGITHGVRLRAAHPIWPDMEPVIDGLVAGTEQGVGAEQFDIGRRAEASTGQRPRPSH